MTDSRADRRLTVFVSPHGFGHAARASAVMEALHRRHGFRFLLVTTAPRWFFDESVEGLYDHVEAVTDVGFRQRSALVFDLDATVAALDDFLPFEDATLDRLAQSMRAARVQGVLSDISPLGIAVARRAGLPSFVVENFTWDWLYAPLVERKPELAGPSEMIRRITGGVTWHIQTDPLCTVDPDADLRVPPIGRPPRRTRAAVRSRLGLSNGARVVVLTMGGVPETLPFLDRLRTVEDVHFLITGASGTRVEGNLHLFDNTTRIYMPDFVRAADAVVAKLGYSTVPEARSAGRPLAYVTRDDFRETAPLRDFVSRGLPGFEIPGDEFGGGGWVARVRELLGMESLSGRREGGADRVADFIAARVAGDDGHLEDLGRTKPLMRGTAHPQASGATGSYCSAVACFPANLL